MKMGKGPDGLPTKPTKLKPIKFKPVPEPTILGGANKDARLAEQRRVLAQYAKQLEQVAAIAEVTVAELQENKPLMRFAEKTFGLASMELDGSKSGRPADWEPERLFHLWAWVRESGEPNISEALRRYMRRFDVGGISFDSLRQNYYAAKKSPLVALLLAIHADGRVSDAVETGIAAVKCALRDKGHPLFVEEK